MARKFYSGPEEVNEILREITAYVTLGLIENSAETKQYYLERILIALGIDLSDARKRMNIAVGVMPYDFTEFEDMLNTLEEKGV